MNQVILLGNLTKDPDLRFTAGKGTAACNFTIAVRRDKENSDFINCIAFGKQAETISQYFAKGSKIAVTGRIQTGSYEAKDGTKRYTTDVIINQFEFVEKSSKHELQNEPGNIQEELTPVDDGIIPF